MIIVCTNENELRKALIPGTLFRVYNTDHCNKNFIGLLRTLREVGYWAISVQNLDDDCFFLDLFFLKESSKGEEQECYFEFLDKKNIVYFKLKDLNNIFGSYHTQKLTLEMLSS